MYFSVSCSSTTVATRAQPMKLVLQAASNPPAGQHNVVHNSKGQIVRSCLKKQCSAKQPAGSTQQLVGMPRFVHFSADLVQTRWFLKSESPQCVSRDSVSNESKHPTYTVAASSLVLTSIRGPSPSFSSFEESPVVLEAVKYTSKTLVGTIKVHNLAFEKHVLVRLTKDGWKTVENVQASFLRVITGTDGSRPGIDRFRFSISIDDSESPADSATAISMCVCYRVNGQEHWDNNKGTNYEFKLSARSIDRRKAYTAVANSGSTSPAFAFASVRGQHTSSDAIEMRKSSNSVFSYGFDTPRNAQNHARTSSPPSINRISRTDARRYMRYSEAKFSDNPGGQETRQATPEPANLPIFSATEWSSSSLNGIYSGTTPCDTFASYQTPGPTVHSAAWMPYPRSPLLHC